MNLLISMPIYKTIKDQSNNIKQIDTILTFPRNKKLLKYVKDNKHKADFEYPLSNDGLMYVNNEQKMIYRLVLWFLNNKKRAKQLVLFVLFVKVFFVRK